MNHTEYFIVCVDVLCPSQQIFNHVMMLRVIYGLFTLYYVWTSDFQSIQSCNFIINIKDKQFGGALWSGVLFAKIKTIFRDRNT